MMQCRIAQPSERGDRSGGRESALCTAKTERIDLRCCGEWKTRFSRGFGRILFAILVTLLPTFATAAPTPKTIHVLDARPLRRLDLAKPGDVAVVWDTMHALAALQGLVNRDAPRLYVLYCAEFGVETDQFWLEWLRGEDGWLRDTKPVPLTSLEDAVRAFTNQIKGVVVYDPAVAATSCLASTAAGCGSLLPVRFSREPNSVFALLTGKLGLPVRLWLVNGDGTSKFTGKGTLPDSTEPSSGSAKVDAYRWALRHFIESGKCDTRFAAFYLDAFWLTRPRNGPPDLHTLSNHDYFIARRAFFFDLSPWGDEPPVDDPQQTLGLDKQTLLDVLRGLQARSPRSIIKIGGFPPWPFKYTAHGGAGKHEPVLTEWEFTRLISQFNAYHEADAAGPGAMANASFFAHYPLKAHYSQPNARPMRKDWQRAGWLTPDGKVAPKLFVGHYVGTTTRPHGSTKPCPRSSATNSAVPCRWAGPSTRASPTAPRTFWLTPTGTRPRTTSSSPAIPARAISIHADSRCGRIQNCPRDSSSGLTTAGRTFIAGT